MRAAALYASVTTQPLAAAPGLRPRQLAAARAADVHTLSGAGRAVDPGARPRSFGDSRSAHAKDLLGGERNRIQAIVDDLHATNARRWPRRPDSGTIHCGAGFRCASRSGRPAQQRPCSPTRLACCSIGASRLATLLRTRSVRSAVDGCVALSCRRRCQQLIVGRDAGSVTAYPAAHKGETMRTDGPGTSRPCHGRRLSTAGSRPQERNS